MAYPRYQSYFLERDISAPKIAKENTYYELVFSSVAYFKLSVSFIIKGDWLFINATNPLPSREEYTILFHLLSMLDDKGIHWQLSTYACNPLAPLFDELLNYNWVVHSYAKNGHSCLLVFNYNPWLTKL